MIELKVKYLKGKYKILGLVSAKEAYPVFFKTRFGVHTFGVKFPIDVLIINQDNRVVKLAQNLKPNRIFLWNPKFYKVIEIPAGKVKKLNIKPETKIKLEIS